MSLSLLVWLSNPIMWMIVMMLAASVSRMLQHRRRDPEQESHIVRAGSGRATAVASALMFLTTAYRPSLEFIAKPRIQQQEDAEDDEQGGPDTPKKQFLRQLRSIRNGECFDGLVWRLE
jgi:hypothetical protein